jgi:uncharacterized cupredoxin-like copper-binding protein
MKAFGGMLAIVPTATKSPQSHAYVARPLSRRVQRIQQRKARARHRWIAAIVGVIAVTVGVIVVVSSAGGGAAKPAPFEGTTVQLTLGDYNIEGNLTVPSGPVRLQAFNAGGLVHNVGIRGVAISGDIQHGKSFTLDVGVLAPGTYQLYCDIVGHVEHGMVADLIVT